MAACAAGLLLAGPAAADETAPPAPQLDQPCVVGVALQDPFTCDPVTQLVALMPVPTQPSVVAVPALPVPTGSPAPVVSPAAAVPTATQPTAPAATAPAQPAPAPTRTSGPAAAPVATAPAAPARAATLLQTAQAPATPTNLTAQRVATPSTGSLTALPLSALPPTQALAAVQEPLLAAGNDAAGDGGWQLAAMPGATLPGLLIVLGTAAVAAAAVGNVRAWELRRLPVRRRR